ncbi:lipopolysaccharide assembly protein LapA domain-containing protein [Candidatus Nitronereus thalassa]|uniref:Lipopolysaccharide assembly protein LapA domain-containing protein n=1 Tax=Candidatus Nitronereus thalassa TaxID=3020898 RepID=A0ABU3K5W0_9BACT|nr:lipopolysaccharide assembly protein LapA domain-containing protein [Candidatus Nitronereus thalassa]MDT7041758.1 lipopolysaccharide assembly protein LapA domain-containing protein [Candidatus Nitronereus thalassa]
MSQWKLISICALTGVIVLFTVQNYEVVEIKFLFWNLAMSRALMLFMVLIVGITIGWLLRGHK